MLNNLNTVFNAFLTGIGLCFLIYMMRQIRMYRDQATILSEQTAQVWRWRIVMGCCGAGMTICFFGYDLLRPIGIFDWLLGAGVFVSIGLVVTWLRLSQLER